MKFKLIDLIDDRTQVNVCRSNNGYLKYCYVILEPGEIYDTEGDKIYEESIRKSFIQKEYSENRENILKKHGIAYEIEKCKVCGGRKTFIKYNPIEEVK